MAVSRKKRKGPGWFFGKCPKWLRLGPENWKLLNSYMFRMNLAPVLPQGSQKRGALDFGFKASSGGLVP